MDARVLIFLVIVSICWCSYARDLTANHFAGESALISDLQSLEDTQRTEEFRKNEDLCTFCKKLASDALEYLAENKTQTEIISILHQACTKIHPFEKEIYAKKPTFAKKDKCDLCHSVITEALKKLKDPDTKIVKLLMKACVSTGKNIKKCKSLEIQYTPNILVHAQQLLETKDLCTILHAFSKNPNVKGMYTDTHIINMEERQRTKITDEPQTQK